MRDAQRDVRPGRQRAVRSPRLVRGAAAGPVVLIPAHNEGSLISATLTSVFAQTRREDRVIVIADNCDDDTLVNALLAGAEVFETVGNTDKKAGALNQALHHLLPELAHDRPVLVMDADTQLSPGFLATAVRELAQGADAAGGIFLGQQGCGLLGQFQRNEYLRYARQVSHSRRVWVLTGTGTVFRAGALKDVQRARADGTLPGGDQVYDTSALTEDNELTLALKTLGRTCVSPRDCRVETEVMPTWRQLWSQRLRWQRGALENLRTYGITRTTLPYLRQQVMMALGVLMLSLYLSMTVTTLVQGGALHLTAFWGVITAVFVLERVLTVRAGGWRAMLLAAPLVVELVYDLYLHAVFVKATNDVLRRAEARWGST